MMGSLPSTRTSTSALMILMSSLLMVATSASSLQVGFYQSSCPSAESIVQEAVMAAVRQNPGIAAGLIRMHFHDCFVRGCDASVLLDSTSGEPEEKDHGANLSLRGFEVIESAKAELEAVCPQTVSCSDILAFAARDSALAVGGIDYAVPAGRRDGRVSLKSEVDLPGPFHDAQELKRKFADKGLTAEEMVTLSGAHSIGIAHCSTFSKRLYDFNDTHSQDPSMNPVLALELRRRCPPPQTQSSSSSAGLAPLDVVTPDRLDNRYYKNLGRQMGVLTSDQTLMSDPSTRGMVRANARHKAAWASSFADAMVRMGEIGVLTGQQGEIRTSTTCRLVN